MERIATDSVVTAFEQQLQHTYDEKGQLFREFSHSSSKAHVCFRRKIAEPITAAQC